MKPMLAAREFPDLDALTYPLYASPKMDGVRAMVVGGKIISRKLEYFPNEFCHMTFDRKVLNGYDGELIVGDPTHDQVRNRTSGFLNSFDKLGPLTFHVFDRWDREGTFEEGWSKLQKKVSGLLDCRLVPHWLVHNKEALLKLETECLQANYEGLILRSTEGKYKFGRSTLREQGMLKLKRFIDAEAVVLRVNEEMKNTNKAEKDNLGRTKRSKKKAGLVGKGRAGELEVLGLNGMFKGVEFVVPLGGAGDEGKKWWWEVGKPMVEAGRKIVVTYKFFPKGVKEKPLLPTYVGIRDDWDFDQ